MDRNALPHGAKGIEGDGFAVEFRDDKIVFVPKSVGSGKHYTLHVGPNSGVMDVHETTIDSEGREQHRTLFALRKDDSCRCCRKCRRWCRNSLASCGHCGWAG